MYTRIPHSLETNFYAHPPVKLVTENAYKASTDDDGYHEATKSDMPLTIG